MYCKNCNAPINDGDAVCQNCNTPVAPITNQVAENPALQTNKNGTPDNKKIIMWVAITVCCLLVLIIALILILRKPETTPSGQTTQNTIVITTEPISEPMHFGNSQQNVMNDGLAVTDGEYTFFTVKNIDYSKAAENQNDKSAVYRMKADGSERTPILNVDAIGLNLVDGFIYYTDLKNNRFCKADYNGGNIAVIYPQALHSPLVTKEYIYYIDRNQYSLRRMNIDGTNDIKLIEDSVDTYFIINDEIYYKINESDAFLNKCTLDGKNPQRLDANVPGNPVITEDTIYCTNKTNMVYKASIDGAQEVMLFDGQANGGLSMDQSGYLYFSNISTEKSYIHKVKTDGTGSLQISAERGAKYINVCGDYLFCMDDDEYSFMLKTDGTGYELLSAPRNMESDEYFKSVLKKKNADIKDEEILSIDCADFDGDSTKEAYAFVGRFNQTDGYYNGELWFVTKENATKFVDKAKYSKINQVISFGKKSCVVLESYSESDDSVSYVYGAEGGSASELRISGKGKNIHVDENGTLLIYHTAYDSSVNDSGKTVKPYYYFYSGDNFCEFGGMELTVPQLKEINGGLNIIQNISIERKRITGIYYRDNGIININVTDGEWREYYNARYISGSLVIVEKGEGEYSASLTPKYAITPTSVNLYNSAVATTEPTAPITTVNP